MIHGAAARFAEVKDWQGTRWGTCCAFGFIILLAISFGPTVYWCLRERAEVRRLGEEARRLGGWAGVAEGGWDIANRKISIEVDLGHSKIGDDDLARLVEMPAFRHVRALDLAGTRITDKGLPLIPKASALDAIDLSQTNVTDACFGTLAAIRSLSNINLSGTRVSDAGLDNYRKKAAGFSLVMDVTDTGITEGSVRELLSDFQAWNIIYGSSLNPKRTR